MTFSVTGDTVAAPLAGAVRPDTVIAFSDTAAMTVIGVFEARGRVGGPDFPLVATTTSRPPRPGPTLVARDVDHERERPVASVRARLEPSGIGKTVRQRWITSTARCGCRARVPRIH